MHQWIFSCQPQAQVAGAYLDADAQEHVAQVAQALAAAAAAQGGAHSHGVALLHQHLRQAVSLQILAAPAGILREPHHQLHQLQSHPQRLRAGQISAKS